MALQFLNWLFSCSTCEHKQAEIAYLRQQVKEAQDKLQEERQACDEKLANLSKDCLDRVMARSYTEYAVGQSTQGPVNAPQPRSDEEEWAIENKRRIQLEREVQQIQAGLKAGSDDQL